MSDNDSDNGSREPEAKEGKSDEIFEVEQILNHKVTDDNLLMLVRWSGYDSGEDTWEPEEDLRDSAGEVVAEYYKKLKVNDKTELIDRLQKQIRRNKAQNAKKRERSPSVDEDEYDSDESGSTRKPKKNRKSNKDIPSSSNTPRSENKTSRKSFETSKKVLPTTPNNAKKAAMEIRDARWDDIGEESDNSDTEAGGPDDIDKMRMKVGSKPSYVNVDKSGAGSSKPAETKAQKERSETPQTEEPSSSCSYKNKKQTGNRGFSIHGQHKTEAPILKKEKESVWTIQGIVRHSDERNNRQKLVLLKHKSNGEEKVLTPEEAFDLEGWTLTKYLLDRCEF